MSGPTRLLRRGLLVLLAGVALGGCGGEDLSAEARERAERVRERAEEVRDDVERRARELRDEVRERRERIVARIEEVLGDLEQIIPEAPATRPEVQRRPGEQTVEQFLTDVLQDVDAYWTRTLAESGRPEPRVSYAFPAEGTRQSTACGTAADDRAAFYCPADDTIYIAQRFAAELYSGVADLPGGTGQAAGSFGVAYVVAHEYAHNLQTELGVFRIGRSNSAKPFELQADCLAGSWGNSAFAQGDLTQKDISQAVATVQAVGDFDVDNEQHHGTPTERRDAWLAGFRTGDPSACTRYVPQV